MYELRKPLRQSYRWVAGLAARILSRLAPRAPQPRPAAASGSDADTRARFWEGVREGRREAAARTTRGAP